MNSFYTLKKCASADDQAKAMPGWIGFYDQMDPGAFHGSVVGANLGAVLVYREEFGLRTHLTYRQPEGSYFAWFMERGGSIFRAGFEMGGGERHILQGPDARAIIIEIDAAALNLDATPMEGLWTGAAARSLGTWLNLLLDPELGDERRNNHGFMVLAPDLITDQLSLLVHAPSQAKRPSRACQLYRRSFDWIRQAQPDQLTVTAIARATGETAQDLRAAFASELDLSLDQCLIALRLNAAQRALQKSQGATVSSVALDHGFSHWGRFSRRYFEFFGNLPSADLSQIRPAA